METSLDKVLPLAGMYKPKPSAGYTEIHLCNEHFPCFSLSYLLFSCWKRDQEMFSVLWYGHAWASTSLCHQRKANDVLQIAKAECSLFYLGAQNVLSTWNFVVWCFIPVHMEAKCQFSEHPATLSILMCSSPTCFFLVREMLGLIKTTSYSLENRGASVLW